MQVFTLEGEVIYRGSHQKVGGAGSVGSLLPEDGANW